MHDAFEDILIVENLLSSRAEREPWWTFDLRGGTETPNECFMDSSGATFR